VDVLRYREIAGGAGFHDVVSGWKVADGGLARHVGCIFGNCGTALREDSHSREPAELRSVGQAQANFNHAVWAVVLRKWVRGDQMAAEEIYKGCGDYQRVSESDCRSKIDKRRKAR
jgi:hypothetical protein